MEAKNELVEALCLLFPGAEARERIVRAISPYTVAKEVEGGRSNLKRRMAAFLAAKRIDGLSPKTLKNYRYTLDIFG